MVDRVERVTIEAVLNDLASGKLTALNNGILAIGGAYLSWRGVKELVSGVYNATATLQSQMIDLRAAVERTGESWRAALPEIEEFTDRIEDQKGVVDDYARVALQRAIDFTHDLSKAQDLVSIAADIAAAKHVDLTSATETLGKAYQGNVTMLVRMIPELKGVIDETSSLNEILQALKYFEGAAAAETEKLTSKYALMTDAIGDVNEALGRLAGSDEAGGGLFGLFIKGVTMAAKGTAHFIDGMREAAPSLSNVVEMFKASREELDRLNRETLAELQPQFKRQAEAARELQNEINRVAEARKEETDEVARLFAFYRDFPDVIPPMSSSIAGHNKTLEEMAQRTKEVNEQLERFIYDIKYVIREGPNIEKSLEDISNAMGDALTSGLDDVDRAQDEQRKSNETKTQESNERILESNTWMTNAMGKAFKEGLTGALNTGINRMLNQWSFLRMQTSNIWIAMAQDFTRLFIQELLNQIAIKLVAGLLKLLKIFDVPANDRFMMEQGADAGKYFNMGFLGALSGTGGSVTAAFASGGQSSRYSAQPGASMSGGVVNIYIRGEMTPDFIKKEIVGTIQRAANNGFGAFKYDAGFTTGRSVIPFD